MNNPIVIEDLKSIREKVAGLDKLRGSTVLITGCAGFLGFYLTQFLVRYAEELGIEKVIGLDIFLLDKPKWLTGLAEEYPGTLSLQKFDISKDNLADIDGAATANFVIHGASIASPAFYRKYPVVTLDANIWGLRHLLDFYREQGTLDGFLFFSSSEIYGDPDPKFIPTDEEYRGNVSCHGPRACYDEAKRFGETMCWVYASEYELPLTIARPFNNYGPGMRIDDQRLPADFAKQVLAGEDIVILSDGTPTRTFCYVSDAVSGYLACLLHGKYDYFNIGIEEPEIMVRDVAKLYQAAGRRVLGYTGAVKYDESDDPDYMTDNPNRRSPIIKKARDVLGYAPEVLVDEGVERYLRFLAYERDHAS